MDRLGDHRFVGNYFRLYLHSAAMNLLGADPRIVLMRQGWPARFRGW
jgi:hypothetical protein